MTEEKKMKDVTGYTKQPSFWEDMKSYLMEMKDEAILVYKEKCPEKFQGTNLEDIGLAQVYEKIIGTVVFLTFFTLFSLFVPIIFTIASIFTILPMAYSFKLVGKQRERIPLIKLGDFIIKGTIAVNVIGWVNFGIFMA